MSPDDTIHPRVRAWLEARIARRAEFRDRYRPGPTALPGAMVVAPRGVVRVGRAERP